MTTGGIPLYVGVSAFKAIAIGVLGFVPTLHRIHDCFSLKVRARPLA